MRYPSMLLYLKMLGNRSSWQFSTWHRFQEWGCEFSDDVMIDCGAIVNPADARDNALSEITPLRVANPTVIGLRGLAHGLPPSLEPNDFPSGIADISPS